MKSSENLWFCDHFRGNRTSLIHLNSFNIEAKFGDDPMILFYTRLLELLI